MTLCVKLTVIPCPGSATPYAAVLLKESDNADEGN